MQICCNFFAEKMWVAFALQNLLTFFQQKISEYYALYIKSAKTVNEMTLNKLIKLMKLWTTDHWLDAHPTEPWGRPFSSYVATD